MIFIPLNLEVFFMEVETEPGDGDVVAVLRTEVKSAVGGFDGAANGREGRVDFGFGFMDERAASGCARSTDGGLDGSEGWTKADELEDPSC